MFVIKKEGMFVLLKLNLENKLLRRLPFLAKGR
jgi:hypothetical protein